jgi:hypothetical protein
MGARAFIFTARRSSVPRAGKLRLAIDGRTNAAFMAPPPPAWQRQLRRLGSELGQAPAVERSLRHVNDSPRQHPLTEQLLLLAVQAFEEAAEPSAAIGEACAAIHERLCSELFRGEYAEGGAMLNDAAHGGEPFVRLAAMHGVSVFPKAQSTHHGKEVLLRDDVPPDFTIAAPGLFKGLYGAMLATNETIVSHDCFTDPRHIAMPRGHREMRNLIGRESIFSLTALVRFQ